MMVQRTEDETVEVEVGEIIHGEFRPVPPKTIRSS
jgi:hypothetical protein